MAKNKLKQYLVGCQKMDFFLIIKIQNTPWSGDLHASTSRNTFSHWPLIWNMMSHF